MLLANSVRYILRTVSTDGIINIARKIGLRMISLFARKVNINVVFELHICIIAVTNFCFELIISKCPSFVSVNSFNLYATLNVRCQILHHKKF